MITTYIAIIETINSIVIRREIDYLVTKKGKGYVTYPMHKYDAMLIILANLNQRFYVMTSYRRPQNTNSARAEIWRRIEEDGASLLQLLADPPKKNNGTLTSEGNIRTEYQQCQSWKRANSTFKR